MSGRHRIRARSTLAVLVAAFLSACATPTQQGEAALPPPFATAPAAPAAAPAALAEALAPQRLVAGECGIFFWSAGPERPFIAFENLSYGILRIQLDGRTLEYAMDVREPVFVIGDRYERRVGETGHFDSLTLTAQADSAVGSDVLFTEGFLRVTRPDGSLLVQPVRGASRCATDENTSSAGSLPTG
ncbi:hypothetical protein RMQ97_11020 [Maricaulis sp. D1M11]|uniref:hypothetical protein n=1 Tax=Maricaulis sp. D1M11 TaxID=3076117 RepID=UPI0039B5C034